MFFAQTEEIYSLGDTPTMVSWEEKTTGVNSSVSKK